MCVTGTMMLCYEVSMGDILMNAAALSIVLELDNLIFVAFAPGQVRALIKSMLPIPRPHDFKFHGLSVRYPAILSAMMIWVVILFYAHLKPQRKQIQQAQDAICGGNLGFVSSVAANGAVVAAKNDLAVKGFDKVEQLYRYRAMQQMIEDMAFVTSGMSTPGSRPYAGDLSGGSVGTRGPSYSLKAISQMQVKDITGYWNTNCGDAPNPDRCVNLSGGCWQFQVLQDVTNNATLDSCAKVKSANLCGADTLAGIRARQYCAATCGCDDIFAIHLYPDMDMGCPSSCRDSAKNKAAQASVACQDATKTSKPFLDYLKAADIALNTYPPDTFQKGFAMPVKNALVKYGCGAVVQPIDTYGYKIDLCSDFNYLHWKSVHMVCPVSCGCTAATLSAANAVNCPHKCLS
jgi:hypothetical protein